MATAPATCPFCGRGCEDDRALTAHVQADHAGRPWVPKCEICGATFESPSDLKTHHEVVHHSGRN